MYLETCLKMPVWDVSDVEDVVAEALLRWAIVRS